MRLILIGGKKEFLSSIIPENSEIDTVVLSTKTTVECAENQSKELVIVDLDNITEDSTVVFAKIACRSTSPVIWAYYTGIDAPVRKKLLQIGFHNVFGYGDDIAAEIRKFAQNT